MCEMNFNRTLMTRIKRICADKIIPSTRNHKYQRHLRSFFILHLTFYILHFTSFSQECGIIYVTPSGSGNGTKANPSSLANAFNLVSATNNQIWLAVGNYTISNELPMISGATLEGGFLPSNNWEKTNSQQSIIFRNNSNMAANPNRIVAVECTAISNFNIHDLTIITADATGTSVSNYGIHISASSDYILARVTVTSGNATDGIDGMPGADGMNGANGQQGQPGDEDGGCCTAGGAGGAGSFPGSNAGGNGGNGGDRGTGSCLSCLSGSGTAPAGSQGQTGAGTGGGIGGAGGQGTCQCASAGCDATPANYGQPGANGSDGAAGTNGTNGIPIYANYFVPGDGQNGAQGEHGSGGGGGGGGGSQGCLTACFGINENGAGPGGGGGGEGGQGGFGASGGTGGGASFAIYIDSNGTNTFLKDAVLNSGLQGIGGRGGTPGGNGGIGGFGGPKRTGCDIGDSGKGGDGGKGGNGGNGGNGADGVSLPLFENSNGDGIVQSDMKATVEPAIYLLNTGCTYHDINYTTNATGIIQWFFDGGSTPLSAVGDSVKTQYTTQGRHSITLVVDGVPYMFTDFTGIFSDGTPFLPTITGPDTVCPGNTGTFGVNFPSVFSVTGYDWKMYHPGSTVPAQTGNGSSFNYVFPDTSSSNYAGTYMLTLQTQSQCCGWSKTDTFYIDVVPYLKVDVFVSANKATICDGETASFFAIPINGGNNPSFQWSVNGVNTGTNTNTFSSSSFNNGDIITCTMTSSYACPLNSPATSLPFTITVNPLPTATCATTGNFLGANTSFTANPIGGTAPYSYYWNFGDGGIDTSSAPNHLYGGTGTFNYSVSVTDANGCTGVCTGTADIVIAPLVTADFTFNTTAVCGSTTVDFTDASLGMPQGNPSNTWLWNFGDGNTSLLQNPSHTYTIPGNYSVTLTVSNGVFSDTYVAANIISVKIVPTANISYITDTVCYPIGVQFFDVSSGVSFGGWSWDFGDGNTVCCNIQNPYHVYIADGTYPVTLTVTSIDGCTATANATIYVLPAPEASFTQTDTIICSGETVTFSDLSQATGSSLASWFWDFGNGTTDTTSTPPTQQYDNAGFYTVYLLVKNALGCPDDTIISNRIEVKPQPIADFKPDTTEIIFPDNDIALANLSTTSNGSPITSWLWDFGNGMFDSLNYNATAVYHDSGKYTITLYTMYEDKCIDSMKVNVIVVDIEAIYFSNSFTPNNDGINDVFYIYGNNISELKLYIFNRWGDMIFESDDRSLATEGKFAGWDGKVKGVRVPDGIYPFKVEYKLKSTRNKLHSKIGSVMVLGK